MHRTAKPSKAQKQTALRVSNGASAEIANSDESRIRKTITITIDKNLILPGKKLAKRNRRSFSNLFEHLLDVAVQKDKEEEAAKKERLAA